MIKTTQTVLCDFCGGETLSLVAGIGSHDYDRAVICTECVKQAAAEVDVLPVSDVRQVVKHPASVAYEQAQHNHNMANAAMGMMNAQSNNIFGAAMGMQASRQNNLVGSGDPS